MSHQLGSQTFRKYQWRTFPKSDLYFFIINVKPFVGWYENFSSYDRLVHVTAHMHRFIRGYQKNHMYSHSPHLQRIELDEATRALVAILRRCHFSTLINKLSQRSRLSEKYLAKLNPYRYPDGAIRVGSCLRYSALEYDTKHPWLLA